MTVIEPKTEVFGHCAGARRTGGYAESFDTAKKAYDGVVSAIEPGRFDLHTHSLFSDGTMTPAEIVTEAAHLGLAGIALTDHDTIEGWAEARTTATTVGIDFLPGIEITTKHEHFSVHLLAYGVDPTFSELFAELARIQQSRLSRAEEMVGRLSQDFDIDWHEVNSRRENGGTVGRPHIADALVRRGHFADRGEVFEKVLHPGSPYYVRTYAIDTLEAVKLVNAAGGVAVLAHPAAVRQRGPAPRDRVRVLRDAGLWGIELNHPENRPEWIPELEACATEFGLEITGASDYHGAGKANQLGERTSSVELVERLRARVTTPR